MVEFAIASISRVLRLPHRETTSFKIFGVAAPDSLILPGSCRVYELRRAPQYGKLASNT